MQGNALSHFTFKIFLLDPLIFTLSIEEVVLYLNNPIPQKKPMIQNKKKNIFLILHDIRTTKTPLALNSANYSARPNKFYFISIILPQKKNL